VYVAKACDISGLYSRKKLQEKAFNDCITLPINFVWEQSIAQPDKMRYGDPYLKLNKETN